PRIALPAADLAEAPEEARTGLGIDRNGVEDDAEIAARPARGRIGNLEPAIDGAGIAPFAPVEIHVLLRRLLEDEAGLGLADREFRPALAGEHRMRLRVQELPVHRVHVVVVEEAPRRLPFLIG